jgi:hypothetical protein
MNEWSARMTYEDAESFSAGAGEFLQPRAVHPNLILTRLAGRLTR